MAIMFVTPDVFQPEMVPLKTAESQNMKLMSVTWEVFQAPIFWLNERAPLNMSSCP